jgi:arginine repressor
MLGDKEKQILGILNANALMRKEELVRAMKTEGVEDGIPRVQKLQELGYVSLINTIGSYCYALTRDGMRVLKA